MSSSKENKIDQTIDNTTNIIDRGVTEVMTSNYMRVLFKFATSIGSGVISGFFIFVLVYELSAQKKIMTEYNVEYTAHNETLAITLGILSGFVVFIIALRYLHKVLKKQ